MLLSLEFDKLGRTDGRSRRRRVYPMICGRGVGTLYVILALLPSLPSVEDDFIGVRIRGTQQPVFCSLCKGLVPC